MGFSFAWPLGSKNPDKSYFTFVQVFPLHCKRNERGKVSFNAFKFYIKYIVKIEETIAKRKNSLKAHFSKWDPLKGLKS